MVMVAAMTAEEIMAAEAAAAAAETAAAEAAAAQAASASTAASTTAAAAPSAGIMGAGTGVGTGAGLGSTGAGITAQAAPAIEAATAVGGQGAGTAATQTAMVNAMETAGAAPGGITAVPEAATTLAPAGEGAGAVAPAGEAGGLSAQQKAYIDASTASLNPATPGVSPLPPPSNGLNPAEIARINSIASGAETGTSALNTSQVAAANTGAANTTAATGPYSANYTGANTAPVNYSLTGGGANTVGTAGQGISLSSPGAQSAASQLGQTQPSMFDKFATFAKESPFLTGAAAYVGAYNMGLLDPRNTQMPEKKHYGNQYTISKDFKATEATPNVYTPSYKTYAEGGVMSVGGPTSEVAEPRKVINPMATMSAEANGTPVPGYAKGGNLSDTLDFYKQLTESPSGKGATAPKADADVGIYYDLDPETRYQDPLTAAQIRQSKLNKRANLQLPTSDVMKRPTPMGQLNLAPPGAKAQQGGSDTTEAAQGGIMQAGSSLGSYAAGGNARLLKGPGDGMSDNIPAMIGHKQPARLADGEFVVPADVVSHLGNGSTEAGAKRLHEMMSRVRKERTGNPKQGKQINPNKYLPK